MAEGALKRLERRLQRERAARLEAEAIAEKGLRELFDQTRRLVMLETIAAASNQSTSVDETVQFVLRQVCEFTGWPLGHAYLAREIDGQAILVSNRLWHAPEGPAFAEFQRASEAKAFPARIGLPGRVMEGGVAVWIPDIAADDNFPRASLAHACGLQSAFAFPLLIGREVVAVLEFFVEKREEPNEALLRTLDHIGAQLGRVFERTRAEERLRRQNAELTGLFDEAKAQREAAEAANRAKSAFLAITSHEIRTPLNAVLGLAEALRREDLTERQKALTDGVLDSGAMLLRLLNAVLDMSKIEAGKMEVRAEPFDLRRTAQTIVRVWQTRVEELGLTLDLDLTWLSDPCVLVSDEGKIEQTIVNLLSNAAKFSPPGGRILMRLGSEAFEGREHVVVEVIDQGPGVPLDDRARIFQPFEQTAAGREAGGAGLGLAICAGNIALLGGCIQVDETPEGENRLWFGLHAPRREGAIVPLPAAEPPPAAARPLRILAAEDNAANRQVLKALLEPAGAQVAFVENGAAALSAVGDGAFDLVLMDANMPGMDGVTAVRLIRDLGGTFAAMPIYMVTANVFDEDVARYTAAGVDGVLKKPIEVRALYGALANAAAACEAEAAELRA